MITGQHVRRGLQFINIALMFAGPTLLVVVLVTTAAAAAGLIAWHWLCIAGLANLAQVYLYFGTSVLIQDIDWRRWRTFG